MIAVVPARGGSKGLPRKNLRTVGGRPLIVHTLECARASGQFERIVVTTDDPEIGEVAAGVPGVEVPFRRPAELSGDAASAIDVYLHAAGQLREPGGMRPAALCVLLPTTPLRTPADIDACIALFRRTDAHVVLSVTSAKPAAWQQAMGPDQRLLPVSAGSVANRQSFGRLVVPNGAVYVLDVDALERTRTYFGERTFGHLMPSDRSVDIDGEDDLRIVEALMASRT